MKEILIGIIVLLVMFAVVVWLQEEKRKTSGFTPGGGWSYLTMGPKSWPEYTETPLKWREFAPFTPDTTAWLPSQPEPVPPANSGAPTIFHYSSQSY